MITINKKNEIGYLELISAMILSGTIGMFVEFSKQPVINVVFYRCAIGSICLLLYMYFKKLFKKPSAIHFSQCLLIGLVGLSVVLNWLALFSSYSYTSIGISTTIYHLQPIIVFFLGAFIFKEKISFFRVIWLGLAFLGVLFIMNPFSNSIGDGYLKGCLLALLAASLYAIATLATKSLKNVSPYIIAVSQMLLGTILLGSFVQLSVLPETPLQVGSILILGVVHSAFMYILLYSSFQKLTTSSIAILSYIYPLVAVAIDYLVFKKSLSSLQIVGGLMVLAAGLCNKLAIDPLSMIKKYQTDTL